MVSKNTKIGILLLAIPFLVFVGMNLGLIPFQSQVQTPIQSPQTPAGQPLAVYSNDPRVDKLITDLDGTQIALQNLVNDVHALRIYVDSIPEAKNTAASTNTARIERDLNRVKSDISTINDEIASLKNTPKAPVSTDNFSNDIATIYDALSELKRMIVDLQLQISEIKSQQAPQTNKTAQSGESVSQPKPAPEQEMSKVKLRVSVDRVQYAPLDVVSITGATDASASVSLSIVNSTNQLLRTNVKADMTGKFVYQYRLPNGMDEGFYRVVAEKGSQTAEAIFTVKSVTTSVTSTSGTFSLMVEKVTYRKGDYVPISGFAKPRADVKIIIESPSGQPNTRLLKADSTGFYKMLFTISLDSHAGDWRINAESNQETLTLTIKVIDS